MIGDFIRGGNSKYAALGTATGRAFLTALKLALMLFVLLLAVGVGQFSQAVASYGDVRNHHLEQWALGDTERTAKLALFRKECEARKSTATDEPFKPEANSPVSLLNECAARIGAPGIASEIEAVNKVMVSYSWPLSVVSSPKE